MDAVAFGKWYSAGVASEGQRYREARKQVLENGKAMLPLLQREAANPRDWRARLTAEAWLSWISRPQVCQQVIDGMRGRFGDVLDEPVSGSWSPSARARGIAALGGEATPCILEIIVKTREHAGDKEQEALFVALALLKDARASPPLLEIVNSSSRDVVKKHAVYALGRIGDRAAVAPLITLVSDESVGLELRETAALALGQIRDPKGMQPLLKIFFNEANPPTLRQQAVLAIGGIGDARASGALAERLTKEEDLAMVNRLLTALGEIGDRQALTAVGNFAEKHPDETLREHARDIYNVIANRLKATR